MGDLDHQNPVVISKFDKFRCTKKARVCQQEDGRTNKNVGSNCINRAYFGCEGTFALQSTNQQEQPNQEGTILHLLSSKL